MTLTFDMAKLQQEYGGDTWLCLRIRDSQSAKGLCDTVNTSGKVYDASMNEHREKRSLRANNYMWALIGEIANVTGQDKNEVYLTYIRQHGQWRDFTLEPDNVSTFCTAWGKLGTGWPTEQVDYTEDGERVVIRAYYGSSQYSSTRMSVLLDAIVEDAKDLGIETATEEEQARMLAWMEGK